jgi:hypothetical protein
MVKNKNLYNRFQIRVKVLVIHFLILLNNFKICVISVVVSSPHFFSGLKLFDALEMFFEYQSRLFYISKRMLI